MSSGPLTRPLSLTGIVKSVQSGDTIVIRGRQPGQERVLHLAHLQAPRVRRDGADEAYAWQARDFLRTLLVNREVTFEITYTVPGAAGTSSAPPTSTTAGQQMEFGDVIFVRPQSNDAPVDVAHAVVSAGCAKVRESRNVDQEGESEKARKAVLREAEENAKNAGKGVWSAEPEKYDVQFNMPEDPDKFLAEFGSAQGGKQLDACIEGVNNGSTVRARLQTGENTFQVVNVA